MSGNEHLDEYMYSLMRDKDVIKTLSVLMDCTKFLIKRIYETEQGFKEYREHYLKEEVK